MFNEGGGPFVIIHILLSYRWNGVGSSPLISHASLQGCWLFWQSTLPSAFRTMVVCERFLNSDEPLSRARSNGLLDSIRMNREIVFAARRNIVKAIRPSKATIPRIRWRTEHYLYDCRPCISTVHYSHLEVDFANTMRRWKRDGVWGWK